MLTLIVVMFVIAMICGTVSYLAFVDDEHDTMAILAIVGALFYIIGLGGYIHAAEKSHIINFTFNLTMTGFFILAILLFTTQKPWITPAKKEIDIKAFAFSIAFNVSIFFGLITVYNWFSYFATMIGL